MVQKPYEGNIGEVQVHRRNRMGYSDSEGNTGQDFRILSGKIKTERDSLQVASKHDLSVIDNSCPLEKFDELKRKVVIRLYCHVVCLSLTSPT